jgi:hypothetical protein
MIKLPYVIGTLEYEKHDYAGMIYLALGNDLEQKEIYEEEQKQLQED